ncbi:pyridine nucleotide-disulfide oxidoreductase family protein (plasmid) [Ochrobactrum quorumnocens]|uniref:Pyridine nucleotide-disulfide oxidoreductase family protein n=1 Tax=Ochrobactrum quorumnocens TaxID=271865 RepID=A0A248UQI2_9HYPH|nr:FAD-binding oxidoreductase [[Ochrobactrum] quorumnocens]ASV88651.1 pyridine nucleotide-disulfide oxidoreductase family protein [[Ochrobactrum] quorumnocens]
MVHKKATERRQLRESLPYWQTTPHITVRTKQTPSKLHYDVVIVGAGISGALAAQALANGKRSILIIDRRAPVLGSSMASTAMIQHELDVPLFKLKKFLKKEAAECIWLRSAQSVKSIVSLVHEHNISCHLQSKKALYLAGDEYGMRALASEAEARNAIGIGASFLDNRLLKDQYQIDRTGAIVSDISASANPAQLTAGIIRSCIRQGVEVVANTEITDLVSVSNKVALSTAAGTIITASSAIFCTGYEFLKSLANNDHQIISTWAIASPDNVQLPAWLANHLVWEASDPYLYFRTAENGRLIAGGEDEQSDDAYLDEQKLVKKSHKIAKKVKALIGCNVDEPEYRWAAAFGSTSLGIPMIGAVPGHSNVYAAMGYGGNGITFSKIAAEILSAQLNGKLDRDADLFPFR